MGIKDIARTPIPWTISSVASRTRMFSISPIHPKKMRPGTDASRVMDARLAAVTALAPISSMRYGMW